MAHAGTEEERVLPGAPLLAGLKVLGNPIGTEEFCVAFYARKAAKTGELVDAILGLVAHDAHLSRQSAYLILKYCAEPRIAHLLRAAPPAWVRAAAHTHDEHIMCGFSRIVGAEDWLCRDTAALLCFVILHKIRSAT